MTAHVIRGDVRALPLPDASVDVIVTSPPYFALRSYTDGGEHYGGQIGSEPTPAEYIDTLVDCTREWVRVLKPSGSLWVNLGDKYANSQGEQGASGGRADRVQAATYERRGSVVGFRQKSLLGLPWRYALACIDQLGLILRAEVIWSKPNGLPESVTDRVRRSHEQWFHMVRQPRYYSAVDEIREAHAGEFLSSGVRNPRYGRPGGLLPWEVRGDDRPAVRAGTADPQQIQGMKAPRPANPLGKLPGSVWEIPSEPLKVPDHLGIDHFAAFPTEWPKRLILGWSPPGICVECGEGRRPVVDTWREKSRPAERYDFGSRYRSPLGRQNGDREPASNRITGYACACPEPTAPTRPSVVLDPFGGTGTTALVASALGRIGITVDRSADYCRLASWRITDPAQIAKVLGVARPPVQVEGQLSLIDGLGNNEGEVA